MWTLTHAESCAHPVLSPAHQRFSPCINLLWEVHSIELPPWPGCSCRPTSPLGARHVWSAAFWDGLWGMVLTARLARLRLHGARYWLAALVAGGLLLPTLVDAALTATGRAFPMGETSRLQALGIALFVNAARCGAAAFIARLFSLALITRSIATSEVL